MGVDIEEYCFPLPDLAGDANRGDEYYRERMKELSQKCWDYYTAQAAEAQKGGKKKKSSQNETQRVLRGGKSIMKETLVRY